MIFPLLLVSLSFIKLCWGEEEGGRVEVLEVVDIANQNKEEKGQNSNRVDQISHPNSPTQEEEEQA